MNQTNQMNQNINQQIKPVLNQSPPNHNQVQNLNQPMQNMNQSGQNLNQPGQNSNQPKIKSRVYNNTNLTSQNLVQLIQNTHPMLQFNNNSYHNASHHPMLNNRLLNNQIMNNHPMFNRQNGAFGNTTRWVKEFTFDANNINKFKYCFICLYVGVILFVKFH